MLSATLKRYCELRREETVRVWFAVAVAATVVAVAMLAAGCGGGAKPTGRLGVESGRGGTAGVWLMNTDGSQATRIVTGLQPSWSAQGGLVYMDRTTDGNLDLFALYGGVTERLTTEPANDGNPAWSPDGQQIAFASDPGGNQDVYVLQVASGQIRRLTEAPEVDLNPSWSPDGQKIAFVSQRDKDHEIYVMNADGSQQTRLTFDAERDDNPAWSPDGSKIAFNSFRTGQAQIWLMNPDGSDPQQLTDDRDDPSFGPVWSPDGEWIAFTRSVGGDQGVYTMRADGSKQRRVPHDSGYADEVYGWLPAASSGASP